MSTIPVASLDDQSRADFIVRVYQHLLVAVGAFIGIEALFFATGLAEAIYDFVASASVAWLLILGLFMGAQWLATMSAHNLADPPKQYLGLFGMAVAEALLFAPFLYYLFNIESGGTATVAAAAVITVAGFAALTAVAFVTRKDLSFMRPMLIWAGVASLVTIGGAILFGFELGIWFSGAMIALAGGSILYQTQTIIRRYPAEAHVGAAVQLFASVMLLFWYVLRLVSQLRR
jgi:FtsH-binding integral membrane protein